MVQPNHQGVSEDFTSLAIGQIPQALAGEPLNVKPMAEMANDSFKTLAVMTEQPIKLGVVGV